ncbi:MAG: 5-(carboxyamino)imidazole ribonucleotide synthase [Pseudomonadota bacterium]
MSSQASPPESAIPPGGTIGILGGGQLGRLLSLAGLRLGFKTHIYTPSADCPAAQTTPQVTVGEYTDLEKVAEFGRTVDVITYEFENVPLETARALESRDAPVRPPSKALEIAQDRLFEKQFVQELGYKVAPFFAVASEESLDAGLKAIGTNAILKTRRWGYDGKGQSRINEPSPDISATWEAAKKKAWEEIGAQPSILEGFVPFVFEISILAARSVKGEFVHFDAPKNEHKNGVLSKSTVPSGAPAATIDKAVDITRMIMDALGYVGVIGVEFFVLDSGQVLVNEFAPRVHNSGHWTEAACHCSQFEQHIRAVAGWPLGSTARHSDVVMENLLGADIDSWAELSGQSNSVLTLYGKHEARPGRKMGHTSHLGSRYSG